MRPLAFDSMRRMVMSLWLTPLWQMGRKTSEKQQLENHKNRKTMKSCELVGFVADFVFFRFNIYVFRYVLLNVIFMRLFLHCM